MYLVKSPKWLKLLYPKFIWDIPVEKEEKIIYLTFDDGPHPVATTFVLDKLKQYNAKATFFCIGNNVTNHPDIYQRILNEGHTAGNHTYNHLNGKKVSDAEYIKDIQKAAEVIDSRLFRPPYGRITKFQSKVVRGELGIGNDPNKPPGFKIIMWSVLAGDWDNKLDGNKCAENIISNTKPGSIIVFHDSEKAWDRLQIALVRVLEYFAAKGYRFDSLPKESILKS